MTVAERKRAHAMKQAAEIVRWAHDTLALSFEEIGAVVDADERTVRRWRGAEVAPRTRNRASLDALVDLRHLLETVFESREDAIEWLDTPIRAFRGHPPVTMIRRGRLDDVVGVLATMEAGAFL